MRLDDALPVRAAVRVHQDGQQAVALAVVAGGQEDGGGDAALAGEAEDRAGGDDRGLGVRGDGGDVVDHHALRQVPRDLDEAAGQVRLGGGADGDPTAVHRAGDGGERPPVGGLPAEPLAVVADPADGDPAGLRVGLGVAAGGGEEHLVLGDRDDRPQVQVGPGDGPVADHQRPCPSLVGDPHQLAVRGPRRDAPEQLQPGAVLLLVQHLGGAGGHVHAEDPLAALVAGLHLQQRHAARRPVHPAEVREGRTVPGHLGAPAVQVEHPEPDLGVGGAGRRVGDLGGLTVRVGRVRDPPAAHRAVVGALDQQPVALRGPPEAAVAVHLLLGDELGLPPGDVRAVRLGEHLVAAAVGPGQPQLSGGVGVGDVRAVR